MQTSNQLYNLRLSLLRWFTFSLFLIVITYSDNAISGELGINVYGLTYHFDRKDFSGNSFNEVNWGLGLNYQLHLSSRNTVFLESGGFSDSFENLAKYASLGYRFRILGPIGLGINAGYYHSESIGGGHIVAVPQLSISAKVITLNVIYLPKYEGVNLYPSVTAYATLYFLQL